MCVYVYITKFQFMAYQECSNRCSQGQMSTIDFLAPAKYNIEQRTHSLLRRETPSQEMEQKKKGQLKNKNFCTVCSLYLEN